MSPRFEVVQTSAGFHARFRAANGRIVWVTEVYTRRRAAVRAVEVICGADVYYSAFQEWPEIHRGDDLLEIRDVDERGVAG